MTKHAPEEANVTRSDRDLRRKPPLDPADRYDPFAHQTGARDWDRVASTELHD